MKRFVGLLCIASLAGCISTEPPKLDAPDLAIAKMKLPESISVSPLVVPDKPKGEVFIFRREGNIVTLLPKDSELLPGDERIMLFNADRIKRLNLIHNSAKGNEQLVLELDKAQLLNLKYAENMKALAELEEARVARLEADLNYAEARVRQANWEKNVDTWTWKIVAILALVAGI